jgi:hypothetical protein
MVGRSAGLGGGVSKKVEEEVQERNMEGRKRRGRWNMGV